MAPSAEPPLRVLLLAAGWGTRLGSAYPDRPKALLELVPGRALHPIDLLVEGVRALPGLEAIDVWTHERFRPAFEAWVRQTARDERLHVYSNGTDSPQTRLGAIGDLAAYLERRPPPGPLLVLAADNVCDLDLGALAEAARRHVCVVLHDVGSLEAVSRLASVELGDGERISRLREKDPSPDGTLAATALYGVPHHALADVARYLREGGSPDSMGSLLEWWVPRRPVQGLLLPGRWIDVGTPSDLARARAFFAGADSPRPPGLLR